MTKNTKISRYPPRRLDLLHDTGWGFYIDKQINGKQQCARVRFGSKNTIL